MLEEFQTYFSKYFQGSLIYGLDYTEKQAVSSTSHREREISCEEVNMDVRKSFFPLRMVIVPSLRVQGAFGHSGILGVGAGL